MSLHDDLSTPPADNAQAHGQLERRRYLLVLDVSVPSSSVHHLPPIGELIIGRGERVQILIADSLVSREHARLRITTRDVTITDLGSQNGTRVNGEPIEDERALASGDAVTLSPQTTLVFHAPPTPKEKSTFLDRRELAVRLGEELDRSARYLRSVSVLVARSSPGFELAMTHALEHLLRPIDLLAIHAGEVVIVLPELEQAEVGELAERMLTELEKRGGRARLGYATYPTDGADADALIACARIAAEAAEEQRAL